jgi:hypothetical protein
LRGCFAWFGCFMKCSVWLLKTMTRSDRFVFWFRASNLHEISWNQIHFEHQSYLIISMSYIEIVKMFLPYHMVSSTAAGACAWEMLKCIAVWGPRGPWGLLDVTVTQCHAGARDTELQVPSPVCRQFVRAWGLLLFGSFEVSSALQKFKLRLFSLRTTSVARILLLTSSQHRKLQ